MMKSAFVAVAMTFPLLLPAQTSQMSARADTGRTIIVATGTARESFVPDKVVILVTLEAQGMTAEDASSRLATLERAVMDTLRKTVSNRGTTQSFGYGVSPYRNPSMPPSMLGGSAFVGRGIVRVELEHAEDLNRVTSAAAAKGGSPSGNPSYSSSAVDNIRRAAMAKAFEQARQDAEALAKAAGGRLGRLVELSSLNTSNPFSENIATQAMFISSYSYDGGPRVVPSSFLTASVTTRWELLR